MVPEEPLVIHRIVKKEDGSFEAVRYKQYLPGDPQAAYRWLLNRRRSDWTDSSKVDVTGNITVIIRDDA